MNAESIGLFNDILRGDSEVTKENHAEVKDILGWLDGWFNENSILSETPIYFTYAGFHTKVKNKVAAFEQTSITKG